jgi:inorganic pyrophosphatase
MRGLEIWDILDKEGNKTGKTMQKGEELPEGFYHQGADIWILNSENKILMQKRAPLKRSPNVWAMTGGSVIKGETSLQTIERETKEELGISLTMNKVQKIKRFHTGEVWLDTYFVRQDIDLKEIVMQETEVSEVKWMTYEEVETLFQEKQLLANRWEYVRELIKNLQYIGKNVKVKVDQPIGSSHPKYPETIYEVNYGFVPNTLSGDDEELDVYILGEDKPLTEYEGKCIAVIHRLKEEDDKLIIVPPNRNFTAKQIKEATNFVEKYFEGVVIE